jgi:ParB family chromosome partitioning protein
MPLNMEQLRPQVEEMAAHVARKNGRVLLGEIRPSRWQPRTTFDPDALWELAKSIQENGLINPVVVFPIEDGYELVAGERRTRATIGLRLGDLLHNYTPKEFVLRIAEVGIRGLSDREREYLADPVVDNWIRARVMPAPEGEEDWESLHRLAIVENLERANLSALEEARGLHGLVESYGWSQRELAQHLGKSQGWVAQRLGLLDLPRAAQEAVNTRVLTISHARTLQGVPEVIGESVTTHVIARVDKGASSREVSHVVSAIKSFFDVERYEPDPRRTYKPADRNRLHLLRWLIEVTDWEAESGARESLIRHPVVKQDPDRLILDYWLDDVTEPLGFKSIDDAWESFAAETMLTCCHCAWDDWEWDGDEWPYDYVDPPCERMRDPDVATCQRYIEKEIDPEIVEIGYEMRHDLDRLEIPYETEPFNHMCGIEAFVEAFARIQAAQEEWEAEDEEERQTGHVDDIREYYHWQLSLPMEAIEHIRAHGCSKCAHNVRDSEWDAYEFNRKPPPCYFVQQPLRERARTVAPDFGAFVTRDGLMLPRCEMFAYANTPRIKRVEGTYLVDQRQALGWLRQLAKSKATPYRKTWAILQWLDYGRQPGESGHEQDLDLLIEHLSVLWEMPGNKAFDEMIPTLIDVAASEANAVVSGSNAVPSNAVIELVNPVTGQRERFIPIDLDVALGRDQWPHWRDYPEEWPRPWLDQEEDDE